MTIRRLLALLALAALVAAAALPAGARAAAPFAPAQVRKMHAADARIDALARRFLAVAFGRCQAAKATMGACVDNAAQPLAKAFPVLHDVLLADNYMAASPACTTALGKALQGNTDEYDAFLGIHGALAIEGNIPKARRSLAKYRAATARTRAAMARVYASC